MRTTDISPNHYLVNRITVSKQAVFDRGFILVCIVVIALLFLRDVGNTDVPKWIFVIISAIVFLLYDLNHVIVFTCFLIPFLVGLPGSYIFAVGLSVLIIKNIDGMIISKYTVACLLILVIELSSFHYGSFSLFDFLKFAFIFIFTAVLIFMQGEELDYKKALKYFLVAALAAQLSVILQTMSVDGLSNLIDHGVRFGNTERLLEETGMRISFNPNEFGRLCTFSLSILLIFIYTHQKPRTLIISLIVVQILVGSLSLSRNFIFLIMFIAVVYLLASSKSAKIFVKSIFQVGIITMAVFIAVHFFYPSIYESFMAKFTAADITGGRVGITEQYFGKLAQHPERLFVGVGLQDYHLKSDMPIVCHNGTQEVLVTWGILGLLLLAFYIMGIYKHSRITRQKSTLIYILPLLVILVGVQSGQFFSGRSPIYLLPAYAAMCLASAKERHESIIEDTIFPDELYHDIIADERQ